MLRRHCLLTGLPALLAAGPGWAKAQEQELVVTLRAPDSDSDSRNAYIRDAVQLALDKTRVIEGPYRLELSPRMNKSRALVEAARGEVRNFLVVAGVDAGRAAGLAPVPFPIHLGLNRFRVCFVHAPKQAAVRSATSLAAVAKLRHVQGSDWPDVAVMRANGFKVTEVSAYESMFDLVGLGRADLFCRNVLEIGDEIRAQAGTPNLAVDDSLLLSYDLPQYLYTHPGNRRAMERVARGLRQAYGDGSLLALLQRYVQPSLALLNLQQRRLVTLTTPTPAIVEMNDKPFQVDLQRLLAR